MDCNEEEAARARKLAEEMMSAGDFVGAHKFLTIAQRLFPNLESIPQMMTTCDVHSSADKKINGLDDWYGILQVQPFADAATTKKQYRKLARLLHPDKNKFAGGEAAFKLVGEANRLLSDQIKRSQYNIRYRAHSMFARKQSNSDTGRHCSAANKAGENTSSGYTFWTCCKNCGQKYKYLKHYINKVMHCSLCLKSFVACNIGCDGVPPSSSTAGVKQFQDQEMSTSELSSRRGQVEAMKNIEREVDDREKELDRLKDQINSEENKLLQLRKSIQDSTSELSSRRGQVEAMKNIQRELELKKQLKQTRIVLVKHEAPTNYTSQQNATDTEAVTRDAFMDHGNSTLLERDEVASVLRGSLNPGEFILELVQGEIRAEVDLQGSLVENWVLLFEELAKIQREEEPELRLKATQVATLWQSKITVEAPKSSLEALAFLLFIVAYGLEELINQEETALLASSVARYEHAPTLFDSLKLHIPEIVEYLITKRQYIPAVRLICPFKLDKDFPASHLLTKEIMDLRRSALERRPAESSQAKDKDALRLKAVLELVADYKLEMNLPGDLIAKLMIQRENSKPPVVHCSARYHTSASNPQANSPNLASAQLSSVNLKVPKPEEVMPDLN